MTVSDGMADVFFTRQELAARWKCSRETVIRREGEGVLRAYRLGKSVRYKLSQILTVEEAAAGGEGR